MDNYFTNFDYIGATGNFPINDYIDITSNTLNTKIDNINIINTTAITDLDNYYKRLIEYKLESGTSNTYIYNSNIGGEIKFFIPVSYYDPIDNLSGQPYRVKINPLGKLYLYYNYNSLISATDTEGWYDTINLIMGTRASVNTQGIAIGVIQGQIAGLVLTINNNNTAIQSALQTIASDINDNIRPAIANATENLAIANLTKLDLSKIQFANTLQGNFESFLSRLGNNKYVSGGLGLTGFGGIIFSGIYGMIQSDHTAQIINNLTDYQINCNINLTQNDKIDLSNNASNLLVSNILKYNCNLCNVCLYNGFINCNIITQQFIPLLNTNEIKFNNSDLFDYLPYQSPTPSGIYTTTTIDANTFAYTFTGTGQLYVPTNSIVDILLVGAGGRGGIDIYSGGGGAGEVVYYPQYAISSGTYDITIGIDSATTTARTSKITKAGVNQLVALGGGNGAYWNYEFTSERTFPPKAYNSATTRTSTTIMGRTCLKYTMTLNTTGITYGSGTYEIYASSVFNTQTQYDPYRMFDYDNASTTNTWAGANNQYLVTTGAPIPTSSQYFIDSAYKGDWFVIKLPYPIALTKYTFYQRTGFLERAPKNFRVYGSITGTSFTLLQDITGATYTSRIYTNTGLSANTTPYQWYCFDVNNLVGGTNSTLVDIVECKLYGKEPINIYSSSIGGSGGGGWFNPNLPASVKKGSTFAISQNAQYSKATAGYNPVDVGVLFGGSGGSATGTGRFSTTITGTTTSYGLGGYATGATAYATPVATNYGDGGSSGLTQGLGFQGVCIIRVSTSFITKYKHYLTWDKLLNIQVGDGLSVDPLNANRISTSWSKNLLTNDIYNNNGGNVGINCYNSTTILEKFHIADLGGQKGKFLLGTDYDHIKLSHDGYNAYLDLAGVDNYFSIRIDYPPDWVNYNSTYYYDIITILGDGSGFVGIQNTAPTCALDVFGAIKCSGNLTAGGDLNCRSAYFNNQTISGIMTATITQLNATGISVSGSISVPTISPTTINSCSTGNIETINATTLNATTYNGKLNLTNGVWNTSADGKLRMYFATNSHSYWGTYNSHIFRNATDADIVTFDTIGNITCAFETISTTNTDHLGILFNSPSVGTSIIRRMCSLLNTFTGYHRCFTEDPLFDINDWENFRKEYEGRVVISTGKIKTHIRDGEDVKEWTAFTGKEGITIEDALPIIELSRKKKDKRIYGVLGSHNRGNSAVDRMIINGCGEGAIWCVNSNGNLENGDLLQSSDYLGYAEKQDDDLIRNYTIGKVVMDCEFELDNPNYKCEVIEGGIRRAYLACVYMSA